MRSESGIANAINGLGGNGGRREHLATHLWKVLATDHDDDEQTQICEKPFEEGLQ